MPTLDRDRTLAAARQIGRFVPDVVHTFELSVAPWFSMNLCDPRSDPLRPCTPRSDSNAAHGSFPGGGSPRAASVRAESLRPRIGTNSGPDRNPTSAAGSWPA